MTDVTQAVREDAESRYNGTIAKKPRKRNYINNPDFNAALSTYRKSVETARNAGKREPQVPEYVGKAILHIATRLATKPNFSGYAFKDDMIMDGVLDALKYGVKSYNPDRETKGPPNPFAYFTQIIKNAFIRRIEEEKKILATKYKASQDMIMNNATYEGDINLSIELDSDHMDAYLEKYEEAQAAKRKKATKK